MSGSPTFIALLREGKLAAEMLATGVTTLGAASTTNVGLFYNAFFGLSIGMERAAKLAIVLDYYIDNSRKFPVNAYVKSFSHDLRKAFNKVEEIGQRRAFAYKWPIALNAGVHSAIVHVLSDFAQTARYHNLDLLAQGKGVVSKSPEVFWLDEVGGEILKKHYSLKRKTADDLFARQFGGVLNNVTSIMHLGPQSNTITDARELLLHTRKEQLIQKRAQFYTLQIIRFLTESLWGLQNLAQRLSPSDIPFFSEILSTFYNEDSYFKSRKTWEVK